MTKLLSTDNIIVVDNSKEEQIEDTRLQLIFCSKMNRLNHIVLRLRACLFHQ